MATGIIFNIQRYCIHDGKGIRTCVFLKGCPLHCPWCHNPEGLSPAVSEDGEGKSYGRVESADEVAEEVFRDRVYYGLSGGGVTLSGGEPLLQPRFCEALIGRFHERGVDVAVETCGSVPTADFAHVAAVADRFLFDIKHAELPERCHVTGSSGRLIRANLAHLKKLGKPTVLRSPLIAGYNLERAHLEGLGKLAASLPNVVGVELLPYHTLGEDKRRRFGHGAAFRLLTEEEKETARLTVGAYYPNVNIG